MQRNLYVAKDHVKRNHRVEYDANLENPDALLTSLPNDLFGTIATKPKDTEVENLANHVK